MCFWMSLLNSCCASVRFQTGGAAEPLLAQQPKDVHVYLVLRVQFLSLIGLKKLKLFSTNFVFLGFEVFGKRVIFQFSGIQGRQRELKW